jgi:hypothetical protein
MFPEKNKTFMNWDAPVNKTFFYLFTGVLLLFTLGRTLVSLKYGNLGDFYGHLDFAHAVKDRLDPYVMSNLTYTHSKWKYPLIIFPGIVLFYLPLLMLSVFSGKIMSWALRMSDENGVLMFNLFTGRIIDVSLNFIAPLVLFYLFFNRAGLLKLHDFKRPDNKTLLLTLLGFLFMNSSPVIMTTRHGQITMFFSIFLLLTIYARHRWSRTLFFGIAAGMKYSMITIFGPALFLKKHYLTCILAFGIFALIAMSPAIFGNNLIQMYSRYLEVLQSDISGGFNNYAVSGYNMLQLEFFKLDMLNSIAKLSALLLALYIIFRDRKNNSFGMNFLFAVMCLSMLLCYHRLYDISVIMLCLIANLYLFILKKDLRNVIITLIFAGFFLAPLSAIIKVAERIGTIPGVSKIFIMCQYYQDILPVFPLTAIVFLLLTGYSVYLYFSRHEDIVFALSDENGK